MTSATKLVKLRPAIEPELKLFVDEVLVPMLVRDALKDIAAENAVASVTRPMANSTATALHSAEEMMA